MVKSLRDFFLVLLSSALLVLPFHFGALWLLAFFAFIPYFFVLNERSSGGAFFTSFVFGVLFYIFLGYWLTLVNVFGFILMVAYLALYFGFFGMFTVHFLKPKKDKSSWDPGQALKAAFFVPAFWVILEWVRSWMISGIPWSLLAYSQWQNIPFIQISDVTGAYGVSYFVLFVNFTLFKLAQYLFSKEKANPRFFIALSASLAAVTFIVVAYGISSLNSRDTFYKDSRPKAKLRVSVIQGNIPQDQKWNTKIKDIIFEKYRRLTLMSAVEKSDLIVWPETSFPGYLEDEPILASQLRSLVRQSRTDVLVGAPTLGNIEEGLRFYNSAIYFSADGEEKGRYNKVHLVPFGEYIPIEQIFGLLRNIYHIGRFSPGDEKTLFPIQSRYGQPNIKARFGVLICYEDIFPGLVRDFCKKGADFMVNMTNDAWFGKTTAPYQHAQASIFRAVENRVNIIRATNTGLSCFVSPEGRILATVNDNGQEIFVTGHKSLELVLRRTPSFYTRFGDVFLLLTGILCFLAYKDRSKQHTYSRV